MISWDWSKQASKQSSKISIETRWLYRTTQNSWKSEEFTLRQPHLAHSKVCLALMFAFFVMHGEDILSSSSASQWSTSDSFHSYSTGLNTSWDVKRLSKDENWFRTCHRKEIQSLKWKYGSIYLIWQAWVAVPCHCWKSALVSHSLAALSSASGQNGPTRTHSVLQPLQISLNC